MQDETKVFLRGIGPERVREVDDLQNTSRDITLQFTELDGIVFARVSLPKNTYSFEGPQDTNHGRIVAMRENHTTVQYSIYLERAGDKHRIVTLDRTSTGSTFDVVVVVDSSKFLIKDNLCKFRVFGHLDDRNRITKHTVLGIHADTLFPNVEVPDGTQCIDQETCIMVHSGWAGTLQIFQPVPTLRTTIMDIPEPVQGFLAMLAYGMYTHDTPFDVPMQHYINETMKKMHECGIPREYYPEQAVHVAVDMVEMLQKLHLGPCRVQRVLQAAQNNDQALFNTLSAAFQQRMDHQNGTNPRPDDDRSDPTHDGE